MLTKLVAIQRRESLTDSQMAARLGISRPTWNLVRNGHRPLRDEWAMRAAGEWPELTADLLALTRRSVSNAGGENGVALVEPV